MTLHQQWPLEWRRPLLFFWASVRRRVGAFKFSENGRFERMGQAVTGVEKSYSCKMEEAEEAIIMVTVPYDADNQIKPDPLKTVLCLPCNLWFDDVLKFIRHHSQHEIQGEVQCLLCKLSFTTKAHLVAHYENFHNIDVVAAPAVLPESADRDQTTHVDHSYSRAENGMQGDTDFNALDGEGKKDLQEDAACRQEDIEELGGGRGEQKEIHVLVHNEVEVREIFEGGKKKMDGGDVLNDPIGNTEQVILRTCGDHQDIEGCLKAVADVENKQGMESGSSSTEVAVMDSDDKEKNEDELAEDGSESLCKEDVVSSTNHEKEAEEKMDEEEEEEEEEKEEIMRKITEENLEKRASPFDEQEGGSTTLDSIHSEHLDDDDSNTFMEQIQLETGVNFEKSFGDGGDDGHEEEAPLSDENVTEVTPEYEEGDFRFISGLRHRQIRIANANRVTDIGMQVFICLHCDFIDSETGLVNHMQRIHKDILELERTMLQFSREVPADRIFPDNITAEEVIRLSEYHRRNLERKYGSNKNRKGTARTEGVQEKRHHMCVGGGETSTKKKRYVENRVPCLCQECGKVLCRKSALRTHMLGVHSRSRNHLCEVCGKAFRAAYHLSQHRKSHRTKTFSCDLCDFTSDLRMAIFDHQQLHPNKFILCHVCGTVLKSKAALTRHMMVHSESRPFACTVTGCMWRFTSEALCKGHIESHNSPGEFICLECKRRFRKRHHIRRHLKTVHGKLSNSDADKFVAVDAKVVPSAEQFDQIPVTQLSKQHIVITTDEHGTPIFCDQNEELVFDSKTTSLLQVTVKPPDGL